MLRRRAKRPNAELAQRSRLERLIMIVSINIWVVVVFARLLVWIGETRRVWVARRKKTTDKEQTLLNLEIARPGEKRAKVGG